MLPAIVLILFFNGAMTAVGVVMAQKDQKRRNLALALALMLGFVPAWQSIEVLNSSADFGTMFDNARY